MLFFVVVTCTVPALTTGLMADDCTPGGSTDYNTVCQYSCMTGYIINGDSSVTCGSDGEFSPDIPTCDGKRKKISKCNISTLFVAVSVAFSKP